MNTKKIAISSFLHSLGVVIYITLVATLMQNGDKLFGKTDNKFFAPIAFLMLFVFSALTCGLLVLGRPMYLYFSNEKEKAIRLLLATAGWLFVMTLLAFGILIAVR